MVLMLWTTLLLASLAFFLRGGRLHNYLVFEAEKIFREAGLEADLECPQQLTDGGLDFVDLLVKGEEGVVCVEVETSARHVLDNANKARALNLPLAVLVPSRKVQKAVRRKLKKAGVLSRNPRIYVLLLNQLEKELMNNIPLFFLANSPRENRKLNPGKEAS